MFDALPDSHDAFQNAFPNDRTFRERKHERIGTFKGTTLALTNIQTTTVRIAPHPGLVDRIAVCALFNDQDEFDRLETTEGSRVSITQRPPAGGGVSFSSNNMATGRNITIINGIVVGDASGAAVRRATLALYLLVPAGFPLALQQNGQADVHVGPVGGKVDLDVSGQGSFAVATAVGFEAKLSGQAKLEIGELADSGHFSMSGQGSVRVRGGAVDRLHVALSGMGRFRFDGSAREADITISGMGRVEVEEVTVRLSDRVSGMGHVQVHKRPTSGDQPAKW